MITPTDTVVSEERLRECPFCGGEAIVHNYPDVTSGRDWFVHCKPCDLSLDAFPSRPEAIAAWNRRTATPQSGGVVVKGLTWAKNGSASLWTGELIFGVYYVADEEGDRWRVVRGQFLSEAGMAEIAFGSLEAVTAAAQADYEARIRSTLADPIPEAPADEEVGGAMLEKAVRDAHKTLMNTLDGDFGLWSSPAFAKAREAVYPLWKRLDETLSALRRSTKTDKPGAREALAPGLEAAAKWHDAEAERIRVLALDSDEPGRMHDAQDDHISHAAAIRALSAPLAEEQPVATHRHKKRGTEYVLIGYGKMQADFWMTSGFGPAAETVDMREVAVYRSATDPTEIWVRPREEFEDGRFEPLPRSTTGGAK